MAFSRKSHGFTDKPLVSSESRNPERYISRCETGSLAWFQACLLFNIIEAGQQFMVSPPRWRFNITVTLQPGRLKYAGFRVGRQLHPSTSAAGAGGRRCRESGACFWPNPNIALFRGQKSIFISLRFDGEERYWHPHGC